MADNKLRGLDPAILKQYEGALRYLTPEDLRELGYDDFNKFRTDLREAILEFERSPYPPARGAAPAPTQPRPPLFPAPEPSPMSAMEEERANAALRAIPRVEPPSPPTEADLFRSMGARPQRLTFPMLAAQQVEEATMAGPPQVGETTRLPVGQQVDPFGAVRQYLGAPGSAGSGVAIPPPARFTPPTKPADIDPEQMRKKLLEGMPEERKAGETYKSDPYMTMLQTGLRILAAKPELGQGPIAQIAGPVATGVEQFQAEKEKERISQREEAKEAREESYRRFGAQRDVTSKILDVGEAAKARDLQFQNLRLLQEKGASEDALKRAELGTKNSDLQLRRAEVELKMLVEQGKLPPREAFDITQRLEREAIALERIPEGERTPEQTAQLESLRRMQAAVQRATGAYITSEGRRDTAGARASQQYLDTIRKRMADIEKADPFNFRNNPDHQRLQAEFYRLGGLDAEPDASRIPARPSR